MLAESHTTTTTAAGMSNYVNERVEDLPVRILNCGPEYLRSRMMDRDSALFKHKRRSAVELLAESKPLYIRETSESKSLEVDDTDSTNNRSQAVTEKNSVPIGHNSEATAHDNGHTTSVLRGGSTWAVSRGPAASRMHKSSSSPIPSQTSSNLDLNFQDLGDSSTVKPPETHPPPTASKEELRHSPRQLIGTTNQQRCDSSSAPVPPPRKSSFNASHQTAATTASQGTGGHKPGQPPAIRTRGGTLPDVPPRVPAKPRHLMNLQIKTCKYGASPSPQKVAPSVPMAAPPVAAKVTNGNMDIKVNYPVIADRPKPELQSRTNRDIPTIATEEWREKRTESLDGDRQSCNSSIKTEESATIVRLRQRKAISRSRSDLTKRYSNSSDFSELSARLNRNSGDLEKFFNEMGLDHHILEPLKLGQSAQAQSTSSLNLFESVSCLGSADARSCFSEDSLRSDGRGKSHDAADSRTPGSSVVERNARIIKWLCNIKSASSTPHLPRQQNSTD